MNTQKVKEYIIQWLINYKNENNLNGFIVGVSGGIDSAVTSTLCSKTGIETLCLDMPIKQEASQHSRAKHHINWLKDKYESVDSKSIDMTNMLKEFEKIVSIEKIGCDQNHALANTRARLRMLTLYYFASLNNYVVVGTGNKVEDFGIGFFTKYGDGGVDINPIADLLKSEVYLLAKELKINADILAAPPTDGLWEDNKNDEEQIGASYSELEWAMNYSKKNTILNKRQKEVLKIYGQLNKRNQHKMHPIPVCKIPKHLK